MPGQPLPMGGKAAKAHIGENTIIEDIDSDISNDFSADLNYNYDIIISQFNDIIML